MSTVTVDERSPRQIAWTRRWRSARASWAIYRTSAIGMVGLLLIVGLASTALLAPALADEAGISITYAAEQDQPHNAPPSLDYPFGTDGNGRSMLTLVIWGARVSLLVGAIGTIGAVLIGAAIGLSSGYFGGRVDGVLMVITNWFMVIPWLGLALVLAAILGRGLLPIILVIVITSWAFPARIIRAHAWSVSSRPYIERAQAIGSTNAHIIANHVLPNSMPIIFTQMVLTGAAAIYTESLLAFLGMGDPNSVSWGQTLDEAFSSGALTSGHWWQIAFPGICIILAILSLTMIGYAFDQVLNPRLRDR